jgi:hypothetical protein
MKNNICLLVILLTLFSPFVLDAKPQSAEDAYSALDKKTYESIDAFTKDFVKKHHLKALSQTACRQTKRSLWSLNLMSNQALNLEDGRKLAKELAFGLLYKINNEPLFHQYLKFRSDYYKDLPNWAGTDAASPEIKKEYVAFRLSFWDSNSNRPLFPHLAQIRLEDGFFYFHYADPSTQALQDPIVESLESLNLPNYK